MIFFFIAAAIFLFYVFVRFLEATSLFYPSRDVLMTPRQAGMPYEDVVFSAEDGVKLFGWFIPGVSAHRNMLYFHGNAGNIGNRVEKIAFFRALGFNIFIFDYRGYGMSSGRPSEAGLYRDGRAAFDYLTSRSDVGRQPIVLYGASLGGAVAIDTAFHRKPAALVTEAAFTNAKAMAKLYYPFVPGFMVNLRFESDKKIARIACPKLIMHSRDDEIIPYAFGRNLFAAAAGPKEFLEVRGTHNDNVFQSAETVEAGLTNFLEKYGVSQGTE